jgi:hypothetical protein
MVSALNGVVGSSQTGIVHCFIRCGKKNRLLELKAQFAAPLHTDETMPEFNRAQEINLSQAS